MRVCAVNGTNVAPSTLNIALAQAVLFFRQDDDAAAFGRFVRQRRKLRGIGQLLVVNAVGGKERRRLPVAERDRAGFVQQQHVHIARGFHGAAGHGDHVGLDHAVHAGDADGR